MNVFSDAIESHIEWKLSLKQKIEKGELFHTEDVANCHACNLGKWIYGEGIQYNNLPSFERMCGLHERFHRVAAEVARHSNEGDKSKALSSLNPDGSYARTSAELLRALMDCANELAGIVVKGIRNTGKIRELLTQKPSSEVYSIAADKPITEGLRIMLEHNIGSLAVYRDHRFIGMFSRRTFIHNLVLKRENSLDTAIGEMVDTDPTFISPEDSIEMCLKLMTSSHNYHLPVMQDGAILGVVSLSDAVKGLFEESTEKQTQLEDYILNRYHRTAGA